MAVSQQEIPYDKIPPRQKQRLDFLIGLYPDGQEKKEIIKKVMQVYRLPEDSATALSNNLLKELSEEAKAISVISRNDGTQKVELTKKGIDEILRYLSQMRRGNVQQFFTFIKAWMEKNNELAKKLYNSESIKLFLEKPAISCMLFMPHYENDIITRYAAVTGKSLTPELKGDVIDFIGTLVNVKFVAVKPTQVNGGIQNVYFLRKEGLSAFEIMFKFLKKAIQSPNQQMATPSIQKKALYEKPWFVIWVSALLAVLVSLITWGAGGSLDVNAIGSMMSAILIMVGMIILVQFLLPWMIKLLTPKKKS